jgi:hypothetical protein
MITRIKKGSTAADIRAKLEALAASRRKGFNASKYLGVLSAKKDPIKYQQKMRNEWE